ncbi:sulfiredoxin-1 isoform 2-T2 [Spheniscus humboldti]
MATAGPGGSRGARLGAALLGAERRARPGGQEEGGGRLPAAAMAEAGDRSIHTRHISAVHNVPVRVLIRPIPAELEPGKVQSLVETLQGAQPGDHPRQDHPVHPQRPPHLPGLLHALPALARRPGGCTAPRSLPSRSQPFQGTAEPGGDTGKLGHRRTGAQAVPEHSRTGTQLNWEEAQLNRARPVARSPLQQLWAHPVPDPGGSQAVPAPKPPAPVPGHIPRSPFLWECLWNGVVGTPASAPGIKVMKPPRLWGLVLGEAGEQAGKTAPSIPQASRHPSEPGTSVQGGERPLTHPTAL